MIEKRREKEDKEKGGRRGERVRGEGENDTDGGKGGRGGEGERRKRERRKERERERVRQGLEKDGWGKKMKWTYLTLYAQQIAQSLQSMLEYDGDTTSFEETFMATFQVSYSDVFGTMHTHDLKEGGDGIPVSKNNCQVS